jgi:hypothetical protein
MWGASRSWSSSSSIACRVCVNPAVIESLAGPGPCLVCVLYAAHTGFQEGKRKFDFNRGSSSSQRRLLFGSRGGGRRRPDGLAKSTTKGRGRTGGEREARDWDWEFVRSKSKMGRLFFFQNRGIIPMQPAARLGCRCRRRIFLRLPGQEKERAGQGATPGVWKGTMSEGGEENYLGEGV